MTSNAVRAWFSAHKSIITDLSTAVFSVEIAVNRATQLARADGSLTTPRVRSAFRLIAAEAKACRIVVDRAVALPPIPDIDTDVQFRHTMQLQAKWANTMADAATRVDPDAFGRASNIQAQIRREAPLITEELRKVWPTDDPTAGEA